MAVNNIKMGFIELIKGKLKEGVEVERETGKNRERDDDQKEFKKRERKTLKSK